MGEGPGSVVNINIGVLGHVDSGKTSLVRALSTKLSTASLDKHPQSKERGITIDLGFSAFTTAAPEKLKECGVEQVQYTLVDCPGHASLIRTIIGGAQIIDRMILVVDVTKGIQTQTAECLVIGEILTDDLTVVLNKVDLLPEKQRDEALQKVTKTIRQTLDTTRFKKAPILSIAAVIGGDGKGGVGENSGGSTEAVESLGLDELVDYLKTTTVLPDRTAGKGAPFYFAVDHCFAIKGQGTVLTGTVLNGSVEVGQVVELPQLKEERKVKSIQMFRQAVQRAEMGDRAAVCVTNLNAKSLERGVLTAPGSVPATSAAIALVRKVKYFPLQCPSRSKVHVTVGHITTMCTVTFFGSKQLHEVAATAQGKTLPSISFDPSEEFLYDEELRGGGKAKGGPFLHWALLEFDQPIICQQDGMVIGSRLDLDQDTKSCRLAFYGKVSKLYPQALTSEELSKLRVYKLKERLGAVDRVADDKGNPGEAVHKVIVKNMFAKHADLDRFLGKKLFAPGGEQGIIDSTFGKTGKFNAVFPDGAKLSKGDALALRFKHLVFAPTQVNKTIIQDASVASAPTTPPKAP